MEHVQIDVFGIAHAAKEKAKRCPSLNRKAPTRRTVVQNSTVGRSERATRIVCNISTYLSNLRISIWLARDSGTDLFIGYVPDGLAPTLEGEFVGTQTRSGRVSRRKYRLRVWEQRDRPVCAVESWSSFAYAPEGKRHLCKIVYVPLCLFPTMGQR